MLLRKKPSTERIFKDHEQSRQEPFSVIENYGSLKGG
jgi:hypothetical protein